MIIRYCPQYELHMTTLYQSYHAINTITIWSFRFYHTVSTMRARNDNFSFVTHCCQCGFNSTFFFTPHYVANMNPLCKPELSALNSFNLLYIWLSTVLAQLPSNLMTFHGHIVNHGVTLIWTQYWDAQEAHNYEHQCDARVTTIWC